MHVGSRIPAALLLVAACAMPPQIARAQAPVGQGDVEVYADGYFDAASVKNAYDMVVRVPGFSIVDADADVRGYAAAQGNVLIDGARPASKREDIAALLSRIPARSVARIELLRTGAAGIDMAGYPILANVVRRHGIDSEAAIEGGLVASTDGWLAARGKAEYGRRWDDHAVDLAITYQPELDDDSGAGTVRDVAADGRPLGEDALARRKVQTSRDASGSWRQPLAGGRLTLALAARGERDITDTVTTPRSPDDARVERVDEREISSGYEAGLRYVRPLGARSTLELVASQQLGTLESRERSREDGDDETFEERADSGERIGRVDLTHAWSDRLSLAASLEATDNVLESEALLVQDGVDVDLPGSDVRIEEMRYETSLGLTWRRTDTLAVESGMRIEHSRIRQTGDTPLQRGFTYLKPRVSVEWDAGSRNQLRLSVAREVGQLDFGDFVASASLDTGVVSAGNAALEPDKTWRTTLAWEHHVTADAAFTLSWTHDRISDVIDRVLVRTADEVFDAPGNIGDGRRDTLALQLATPLDWMGVSGGRVRTSLLRRDSSVTDPVTGRRRPISEEKPVEIEIAVTQDLPAWRSNWGITVDHIAERKTRYRFDEIERSSEAAGWTLFFERRFGSRWQVRAEATDLFGRDFVETRDQYDGPRSDVPLGNVERRDRKTPGYFSLTFRRSTGG